MSAAEDQTPLPGQTFPIQAELIGEPAAVTEGPEQPPAIDPYTRDVMASRHRAGDSVADLADDYGIPAEQVQAAVEQAPRPVRRRHRWERLFMAEGTEKGTIECLRCRRCGLSARRVPTRTGGSLRLEVLPDGAADWTAEVAECPGEQVELGEVADVLTGRTIELQRQVEEIGLENSQLRAHWTDEQLRVAELQERLAEERTHREALATLLMQVHALLDDAKTELATLKEERRQIQWGSSYLADQAEADLEGLKRELAAAKAAPAAAGRRPLPSERPSVTHKFRIAGQKGYVTVGMYAETGRPAELFAVMAKQGSTLAGLLDAWCRACSMALQYGMPVEDLVEKFSHSRFEPAGFTETEEIRHADSIVDYIARWVGLRFCPTPAADAQPTAGEQPQGEQR